MAIAWIKGCIETEKPFRKLDDNKDTIQDLQTKLCTFWPTYQYFWDTAFPKPAPMSAQVNRDLNDALLPGMLVGRVQLKQFPVTRHEKPRVEGCTECIHSGRLQIECTSRTTPAGMLEQPHPNLDWIEAKSDSLYFAALSISEWQGSENCFDGILQDLNRCPISMQIGENMDSIPPKTLWDMRTRWFHESGLENMVEDSQRIWSLSRKLPLERPPLLVNVMLLDKNGLTARYVCKGWMFLSVWCEHLCDFSTVAISP